MAVVENGVTTLYVGADKKYTTILDAVKDASTTGATEIIVSNGDYEGFTFAASEIGEQKGAITIKAAADAENVNITSPIRIGTYKKGSTEPLELQTWGANVTLEGLNFSNDTTAACLSIENMQTAGQLTVRKCNFVNEVANSNVIAAAKECPVGLRPVFEDCTITGLVSLVSGLQDGIEWNNCDFYFCREGCVNIPGGTAVYFNNCDFHATLTEDSVGNSFYFIRNQNNPYVEINGGSVNLDSELTEAVEKQYDWGLFWTRNNGKQIALNDVEVNLTDAAMMQTESGLAVVMTKVKGENGAILTDPENISVKNMTSGNDVPVEDLLAASTGAFNATQDGQYSQYTYDGEGNRVVETISLDKIYVDGSWTDKSDLGEGKIFGVNAFADYASAKAAVSDVTEKVVIAGDINAGGVFDNLIEAGEGAAYWSGPSPVENTFAVEVNAAVKSGSTVLNNNTVTVGETGSIEAFNHHLTVFGEAGSLVVDGDADGSVRNTEKQLAVSQLRVAFGGSADIRDTWIEVRAITVGADAWDDTGYSSTLTLTNTSVEYHGFGDGSQLNINVKEGNTLSIADSEFVKKYASSTNSSTIAVVNNGTFELSDSSLEAQSFTNNGTVIVSGASALNGGLDAEGAAKNLNVKGNGVTYFKSAVLDDKTSISSPWSGNDVERFASVRFVEGSSTVTDSKIDISGFQVGEKSETSNLDTENDVEVTVGGSAYLHVSGSDNNSFGGWIGTAYTSDFSNFDTEKTARYKLNITGEANATFDYLHIWADGELSVSSTGKFANTSREPEAHFWDFSENSAFYANRLLADGKVEFNGTSAWIRSIYVSLDNTMEGDNAGSLAISNSTLDVVAGNTSSSTFVQVCNDGKLSITDDSSVMIRGYMNVDANAEASIANSTLTVRDDVKNTGAITLTGATLTAGTLTIGAYLNISGLTANTDYGFNIDGNALTATADANGNISLFTTALTDGEKSVTLVDTTTYAPSPKTVTVTNGSLKVNVDSAVEFATLDAAAESITVDTDGYTDGTKRILNNKGADLTKADYEAVVKGDAALDATVGEAGKFIVANGDLYLTDAKQDVLYVNNTYTEESAIAEGKILGYNAFTSVDAAMAVAQNAVNGGTVTIDLGDMAFLASAATGSDTTVSQNGTYKFINGDFAKLSYGFVSPKGDAEANKEVNVNFVFENADVAAGKFRLDNGSSLTITDSHMDAYTYVGSCAWLTFYGDSVVTITDSVFGWCTSNENNSSGIVAGDKITDYSGEQGRFCIAGSGVLNVSKSTVFAKDTDDNGAPATVVYNQGLFTFTDSAIYSTGLTIGMSNGNATEYRDGEEKRDAATMIFDNSVFRYAHGRGDAPYGGRITVGANMAGKLIVRNGSEISFAEKLNNCYNEVNVSALGSVEVLGSTFKAGTLNINAADDNAGTFTVDNYTRTNEDGSETVLNSTVEITGTVTNAGTISLTDANFTAGTVTNNGTFTVSSTEGKSSTLNIGTLTGGSIKFLDGAVIKDSKIGGEVFVAGNVTFRGDNDFAMIYDYGTFTDYYDTTAPMQWTVEAGASVTLHTGSNGNRYGLGYGDKVTINGVIAENGAAAARAALNDDDDTNDVKRSFYAEGLVAQESKGWNCDSSFTVNNAYVTIGNASSFGNKPGNYGGTYTFSFDNAVVDASRITFYEALSTTTFTFKNSDVKMGQFMTRDKDSVFTLNNSTVLSTETNNGTDEGNYNAAELNVINGASLTYSSAMKNEADGEINVNTNGKFTVNGAFTNEADASVAVTNGTFTADKVTGNGTFTVSGISSISGDFTEAVISAAGATINTNGLTDDALIDGVTYGAGTFTITGAVGAGTVDVSADTVMNITAAVADGKLAFDNADATITLSSLTYTGSLSRSGTVIAEGVDTIDSFLFDWDSSVDDAETITFTEDGVATLNPGENSTIKFEFKDGVLTGYEETNIVPDADETVTDADGGWYYGGDAVTTDTASSSIATETKTLNVALTENNEDGGRYFGGSSISGEVEASYYSRNTEVNVSGMGIQNGVYGGNFIAEGADVMSSFSDSTVNITAEQGAAFENLIVGGNRVNDSAFVTLRGTSSVSISGEEATYKDHVIGGSLASGTGAVAENDNTSVTIDCGTFSGNIYGGGYAQRSATVTVENASVTINGGTFSGKIYGGNGAASAQENTVAETTSVTINGGTFNGNIYGGSFGLGRVDVSSTVTINGGTFGDIVIDGDSSNAEFYKKEAVADRNLIFNGYVDALEANIRNFDTVKFLNDSDIDMSNGTFDAAEVDVWSFEIGASIKGLGDVAFESDNTLEICLDDEASGDSWTIMTGSSIDITELDNVIANVDGSLAYFQKSGEVWQYSDYTLSLEDGDTEDSLVVVKKGSIA